MSGRLCALGLVAAMGAMAIGYLAIGSEQPDGDVVVRSQDASKTGTDHGQLEGDGALDPAAGKSAALREGVAALEPPPVNRVTGGMSREQILNQGGALFQLRDRERAAMMQGFGSLLGEKGMEGAANMLGRPLTEEQFEHLREIEEPFNGDLSAIGQLYLDDLDYAKRDIWSRGAFHFEEPLQSGGFRVAVAGESRVQFPGTAIFYRIDDGDYPHLKEHLQAKHQIESQRLNALLTAQL